MSSKKILLVNDGAFSRIHQYPFLVIFYAVSELISHLEKSNDSNNYFEVIVSHVHLNEILDMMHKLNKMNIRSIHVYYDEADRLQLDQQNIAKQSQNIRFCDIGQILSKLREEEIGEAIHKSDLDPHLLAEKTRNLGDEITRKRPSDDDHHLNSNKKSAIPTDRSLTLPGNQSANRFGYGNTVRLTCNYLIASTCSGNHQHVVLCSTCGAMSDIVTSPFSVDNMDVGDELAAGSASRFSVKSSSSSSHLTENLVIGDAIIEENLSRIREQRELGENLAQPVRVLHSRLQQNIQKSHVIDDGKIHTLSTESIQWIVPGFEKKRIDAISKRRKSIYSPSFYIGNTGHRMSLRLYLNGDCDTCNQSICLFLVLVRSHTDECLSWPFLRQVKLTLIDQAPTENDHRDVVRTFICDPESSCFQRPQTNMNHGYGFKNFMSIEDFDRNQSHYVQNDALLIRLESYPITPGSDLPTVNDYEMTPNDNND